MNHSKYEIFDFLRCVEGDHFLGNFSALNFPSDLCHVHELCMHPDFIRASAKDHDYQQAFD